MPASAILVVVVLLLTGCGLIGPDESSLGIIVAECRDCPAEGGGFQIEAHYTIGDTHPIITETFTGIQPGDTVFLRGFPHPRPFIYYVISGIPPCRVPGSQYYHNAKAEGAGFVRHPLLCEL